MESSIYVANQNGNNKQLTFTPEVRKITRLGDMKGPKIIKSPSWPSTPTTPRSQFIQERGEPAYWTLGRKGYSSKVSDEEFRKDDTRFEDSSSQADAFKEIHSILSGMDLAKYYLKRPIESSNNTINNNIRHPLRRSLSVQPQTTQSVNQTIKKSFLGTIPPPPKQKSILELSTETPTKEIKPFTRERIYSLDLCPVKNSRRQVNSKLKELTERLRPSSAPPSPHRIQKYAVPRSAPPTSSFSFFMEPLPCDNSLNLQTSSIENPIKEIGTSIEDLSKNKSSKIPKLARKNNFASSTGYATLPRRKPSEVVNEPRTLASLDLNINFDSHRSNRNTSDENEILPQKQYLNRENIEQHNKKERKEDIGRIENEIMHKTKSVVEDDVETCSNNSSRRGSIKSNSSSSRKADFDLNFAKFGSLTLSRAERRKSISKKDNNSSDLPNRSQFKKNLSSSGGKSKDNFKSETIIFEGNLKENKYNGTIEIQEREFANKSTIADDTQSVPVLPNSFSNPLEEEIRTIAKLLDGKESIFLKLIQSSKIENERSNAHLDLDETNESSMSFETTEKSQISPQPIRKESTFCSMERNSPTRLRAMTVPVTEMNRNSAPIKKSPPPQQKRFYKKRLRGPYGEMLEQEMSKSFNKPRPSYARDLDFLKELETVHPSAKSSSSQPTRQRPLLRSSSHSLDETHSITVESSPKRKTSANIPLVNNNNDEDGSLCVPPISVSGTVSEPTLHIRSHSDSVKTSSLWTVDNLITKVLKQSAQQVSNNCMLNLYFNYPSFYSIVLPSIAIFCAVLSFQLQCNNS